MDGWFRVRASFTSLLEIDAPDVLTGKSGRWICAISNQKGSFGMLKWLGLLGLSIAMVGCNSVRTTFLRQDECGQLFKCPEHHRKGVPVMVKVPTHVEVKIMQTDVWKIELSDVGPKRLTHLPAATSRTARTQTIQTEQMFLVDPKRPASGTGEFGFAYDPDGYGVLQSANYKAVDSTLKDSASLVTNALSTFGALSSVANKSGVGSDNEDLVTAERVIAYRRFPINQTTEWEIEQFIGQYINLCHTGECSNSPAYAQ
jgi:hypothetical protein